MKKLSTTVILSLLISSLAFSAPAKHKPQPTTLFVMSAKRGLMQKVPQGYRLTLYHADSQTLWFTDRPIRKTGKIPTISFIKLWRQSFKGSAPNAALIHMDLTTKNQNHTAEALELGLPHYHHHDLSFFIRPLKGTKVQVGKLQDVHLFIDNAYFVNSQVTDAVTTTNVKVLGEAPGIAMGNLYQQMSQ